MKQLENLSARVEAVGYSDESKNSLKEVADMCFCCFFYWPILADICQKKSDKKYDGKV